MLLDESDEKIINEKLLEIETLIGNDTAFLDKKTIYKVKKNEKN